MKSTDSANILEQVRSLLSLSKSRQALRLLKHRCATYPNDFAVNLLYAQLLGDLSFSTNGKTAIAMRRRAISILRRLQKRLRKNTADERWKVRRHLYYFSGQHYKNFQLGKTEVSRGNKLGYLSQGIGAGSYALELLEAGKMNRAIPWAKKAELAWNRLFEMDVRQPNRLCHFARAIAIQGRWS